MITRERELELMNEAIAEAKLSKAEDSRIHPKVGAILVNSDTGEILFRSHRGEDDNGGHAEYNIFEKAAKAGYDTSLTSLFVTLEPCTRRGKDKIPCAVRIVANKVQKVYIGTLDPNPHITGRGEMFLSNHVEVERFPNAQRKELSSINADFFAQHAHDHIPTVSPYAGNNIMSAFDIKLASQRDGLLQQSMDLISGTAGDILIFAGNLTWLRELQLCLVLAKRDGRSIRMLCEPSNSKESEPYRLIANHLGIDVCVPTQSFGVRGTLIADPNPTSMICIEKEPAIHGHLFRSPHDSNLLTGFHTLFNSLWSNENCQAGLKLSFTPIPSDKLINVLKNNVPAYAKANITLQTINIEGLARLPKALERFKIFRLHQLEVLQKKHNLPSAALIHGSPWPVKPPVVEIHEGTAVVVDGAHRVFSAFTRGQALIEALVVEGVSTPLPSKSFTSWDDVKIFNVKIEREQRYENFKPEHFRPIRHAFSLLAATDTPISSDTLSSVETIYA
ncbi:MAG: deaminase [Prosthecobacter sp.]